jgi:putative N-acetylmannosamine-6-phosphate epimerase
MSDDDDGTSGADARIVRMDRTEHERLRHHLTDLKRLLQQTTDPAATVMSNDVADMETCLRTAQSPIDLRHKGSS